MFSFARKEIYWGMTTGMDYVCFSLNGHIRSHASCLLHGVCVCHRQALHLNPVVLSWVTVETSQSFPFQILRPVTTFGTSTTSTTRIRHIIWDQDKRRFTYGTRFLMGVREDTTSVPPVQLCPNPPSRIDVAATNLFSFSLFLLEAFDCPYGIQQ